MCLFLVPIVIFQHLSKSDKRGWLQRWAQVRGAGVDSGRFLHFFGMTWIQIRRHFSFLAVAWICVVFQLSFLNFGCIDGSRSLNRSRIRQFEKFPHPDLDSKILEQERSRKMWLQPPLVGWHTN